MRYLFDVMPSIFQTSSRHVGRRLSFPAHPERTTECPNHTALDYSLEFSSFYATCFATRVRQELTTTKPLRYDMLVGKRRLGRSTINAASNRCKFHDGSCA